MIKLLRLILSIFCICFSLFVHGKKYYIDGIYYKLSGSNATVVSDLDDKYIGDIVIPSTFGFQGKKYYVTGIEESAFFMCTELRTIKLPNSIINIPSTAFIGCLNLIDIIIPSDNTNYIFTGGALLSKDKYELINCLPKGKVGMYSIPDKVNIVSREAFYECSGITSIEIPYSVTSFETVFYGCINLTDFIVSKENSNYCSLDGVIYSKNKSTLVCYPQGRSGEYEIPDSTISIGDHAFPCCYNITNIELPNSIINIGDWSFSSCSGMKSFIIPNSVINIGEFAFSGCSGLTSITLPNSITSIELGTFSGCYNLSSIIIPNSVTSIEKNAFFGCSALTEIYSNNPIPPVCGTGCFYDVNTSTCTLYVPKGSSSLYSSAPEWNQFTNIIERDLSSISNVEVDGISITQSSEGVIVGSQEILEVGIYTISGELIYTGSVDGTLQVSLSKGSYIIKVGNKIEKIIL